MTKGKLIVFEGGEGSGKSSHVKRTAQHLRRRGFEVVMTHEPGGTKLGKNLRKALLQHIDQPVNRAELLLFLADRAQHVAEIIQPAMKRGAIVLCDRFTGSTLAYQIGARHLQPARFIKTMERYARFNLQPNATIYLDVDPKIGLKRKTSFTRFEYESLKFHQAVRVYFQKLSQQSNWHRLNANRPLTAVQVDIDTLIDRICR